MKFAPSPRLYPHHQHIYIFKALPTSFNIYTYKCGGFPPGHMKIQPGHYKGLHATSKGHGPLLIPVATNGKCKQANKFQ